MSRQAVIEMLHELESLGTIELRESDEQLEAAIIETGLVEEE